MRTMRCSICGKPAIIRLPYARLNLCSDHFKEYIISRVKKTITKYKLIKPNSKIVVGVSGGKDSIALLHMLSAISKDYSFSIIAVHIDLGINKYSEELKKAFVKATTLLGVKGVIIELKNILYGDSIYDFARKTKRPICSVCGLVKRYLLNLAAVEAKADAVATGHNLDDILSYLLKSKIFGENDYIVKLAPRTETQGTAISRIKPLYEISEEEILVYVELQNLPFVKSHCPYKRQDSIEELNKNYLNIIEKRYPGIKLSIIHRFIRNLSRKGQIYGNKGAIKLCKYCGMPSLTDTCSFCKLTQRVYGEPLGPYARSYVRKLLSQSI